MDWTFAIFAVAGLVIVGLAIPLMHRRVKPNGLYGLRCAATFADERVWYEANARSGRDLLVLGVSIVVFAIVLAVVSGMRPEAAGPLAEIGAGAMVVGAIVMAVIGVRRANRLLREMERWTHPGLPFEPGR